MKSAAAALIDDHHVISHQISDLHEHQLQTVVPRTRRHVTTYMFSPFSFACVLSFCYPGQWPVVPVVQYLSDWPLCGRLAHGITANLLAYEYESYDLLQPAGCVIYTATVFETKNVRGCLLQRAYKYRLTVSVTSVEAERAFSTEGSFVQCCSRVWATNRWLCCVL